MTQLHEHQPPALRRQLPLLTPEQIGNLQPNLADVIEYRKSGLSLNHVVGCPLERSYCIRHLYSNFEMKTPRRIMTDEDAVAELVGHRYFRPHRTPIQLFNKATDPMLPVVKPHTFRTLQLLDERGLTNHVLVITRWRVDPADCEILNSFTNIRLTILVTYSNIQDPRIEPVDSRIAAASLRTLYENAGTYRVILYWRPIVPGLNDTDEDLDRAYELAQHAHATVFTGLFYRDEIAAYYQENGIPEPYDATARRKIMPEESEARILARFRRPHDAAEPWGPLFRKTSCAVAYAHNLPDYNGHYGIRELCDICPVAQVGLCASAWKRPDNGYGYQVHAREHPHHYRRHGRADIGWQQQERPHHEPNHLAREGRRRRRRGERGHTARPCGGGHRQRHRDRRGPGPAVAHPPPGADPVARRPHPRHPQLRRRRRTPVGAGRRPGPRRPRKGLARRSQRQRRVRHPDPAPARLAARGVIDTLRAGKAVYPGAPAYGLDALIAHAGIDVTAIPGKRHRAGYDAAATALLLLTLTEHFPTWQDLAAAATPPDLSRTPAPVEEATLR